MTEKTTESRKRTKVDSIIEFPIPDGFDSEFYIDLNAERMSAGFGPLRPDECDNMVRLRDELQNVFPAAITSVQKMSKNDRIRHAYDQAKMTRIAAEMLMEQCEAMTLGIGHTRLDVVKNIIEKKKEEKEKEKVLVEKIYRDYVA